MANPEYEAKVNPAELYNDEIISQFESIRNVIHKEILPSTYNELIVTSNQAGVISNYNPINFYPSTEIIFPLSPQSGNINWLEKNYLRFELEIVDKNHIGFHIWDAPIVDCMKKAVQGIPNYSLFPTTDIGIMDGASIFKSIELNYGGTAIWTSAYQQVEAFFTFANIPDQLTNVSPQYYTYRKSNTDTFMVASTSSSNVYTIANGVPSANNTNDDGAQTVTLKLLIDIDISRLSPILAWMSIIPGFINKLTLRVILDAPINYLVVKHHGGYREVIYYNSNPLTAGTQVFTGSSVQKAPINLLQTMLYDVNQTTFQSICKPGGKFYNNNDTPLGPDFSKVFWRMNKCEIHQCNATMTQDTQIRLISMISQMGGKWIYPCRYWNTTLSPVTSLQSAGTSQFQFILTGCYFRSLSFTQICDNESTFENLVPGNGLFSILDFTNLKIYCDSELIVSYDNPSQCITDTDSALIDNDKYTVSRDVLRSLREDDNIINIRRDCINKALGPPNGLYSGKYTSEKMGTHNIIIQITHKELSIPTTVYSYLSALQDGVIVFDNFNGAYFTTGRKMQQVYEAMT